MNKLNILPETWNVSKLKEVSSAIQYGYTASAIDQPIGPHMLRITDIQENQVEWDKVPYCEIDESEKKKYLLEKNDILFARTGATVGKSYLIARPIPESVFASYLIRVKVHKAVDPRYIAYFFHSPSYWGQISVSQAGIGQPNVNGTKLSQLEIPIAPLNEQKLIVSEIEKQFSRLDEAMAALKRIKANLKRYKASVLKAAVEGKLTEEWRKEHPDVEPASELLKRILVERRRKWEEAVPKKKYKGFATPDTSSLPELPTRWVWSLIGQLCDCIVPNRDKPKSFTGDIPWITFPDFTETNIDIYNSKSKLGLTKNEVEQYRARIIPKGSVIMSCVGRFGITGIPQTDVVINQQLHAFLIPNGLYNKYLAYAIKTQVPYMNSIATATTIRYMNKNNCNSLPIALPPAQEQMEIIKEIERTLSIANGIEDVVNLNLKRAERLRQSILKKAFSGKLVAQDISDVGVA